MGYIKEIRPFVQNIFATIKKGYYVFAWQYVWVVLCSFLKIGSRTSEKIVDIGSYNIYLPNNYVAFLVVQEIFVYELYERISGCKYVLDLGGYIGDSGLYLAHHNKHVTIIESDPINFSYLEKNLKNVKNTTYHHAAVVTDESKKFFLVKDNMYRGTVADHADNSHETIEIKTITMKKLLSEHEYDGLKMDIEGGEYPIIQYCIEHDTFTFHKGFIEFHFTPEGYTEEKYIVKKFMQFLSKKGYIYEIFDNAGVRESLVDFKEKLTQPVHKSSYINMYFELL